ncbi:hypothetical protein Tco_0587644, partial [Tanacetum coccineum]
IAVGNDQEIEVAVVIYATGFNDVEKLKGVSESPKFGYYNADSPRVSLYRVARLLQDKLKADELAKDKIQAEEVLRFEDHVPPHTIRAKVGNVEVPHFGLAFVVKN